MPKKSHRKAATKTAVKTVAQDRAQSAGVSIQEAPEAPETAPAGTPEPSPNPEAVAAAPAVPVTAEELSAPLVAGMPEPTDSPMANNPDGSPNPDAPKIGQVDTAGIVFDPSKHKADETGRPKTDIHGRFYAKNVGRKKGGANAAPKYAGYGQSETPEFTVIDDDEKSAAGAGAIPTDAGPGFAAGNGTKDRFDLMADIYCRGAYGALTTAFSDDGWQPENAAEHEGLRASVAAYLRLKNSEELPPGVILSLAVAAYAGKRVTRPKTKERLLIIWLKIRPWFGFRNPPEKVADESEISS